MSVLSERVVRSITAFSAIGALSVAAVLGLRGSVQADPPAKKPAAKATTAPAPPMAATLGDNTPLNEEQKIVHALNRMGFGPRPGDVEKVRAMGLNRYIEQQLYPEKISDTSVDSKVAAFTMLQTPNAELAQMYYARQNKVAKLAKAQVDKAKAGDMMPKPGEDPAKTRREMLASLTPEQRDALREVMEAQQGVRQAGVQLMLDKTVRAVESEKQLQEVLTDFWSNHFNIDMSKGPCAVYKVADERDVIRKNLFGKFRDLLEASAKSPAMLFYLDNAQSSAPAGSQAMPPAAKKRIEQLERAAANGNMRAKTALARLQQMQKAQQNPKRGRGGLNENYAREIMELHTLGVEGGYTQTDVTEVARCLTGWTFNRQTAEFQYTPGRHDDGEKKVLGKTIPAGGGMQDGETVLDMLSTHPSTMRFVSTKLCQRFVSDDPPKNLVDKCVATWKRTDGDLREIYRTILTSPEFYSRAAYRQKIKSPFEYAVSAVRALGGTVQLPTNAGAGMRLAADGARRGGGTNRSLVAQVATMGQPLYRYQAPTGYPEDSRKWVSSGALIARLNYSLSLAGGQLMEINLDSAKDLIRSPEASDPAKFVNLTANRLLNGEVTPTTRATLLKQAQTTPGKAEVAAETSNATRIVALVLGSPEFQRR
jgi:uncharacterized protein (DUF1800 family)